MKRRKIIIRNSLSRGQRQKKGTEKTITQNYVHKVEPVSLASYMHNAMPWYGVPACTLLIIIIISHSLRLHIHTYVMRCCFWLRKVKSNGAHTNILVRWMSWDELRLRQLRWSIENSVLNWVDLISAESQMRRREQQEKIKICWRQLYIILHIHLYVKTFIYFSLFSFHTKSLYSVLYYYAKILRKWKAFEIIKLNGSRRLVRLPRLWSSEHNVNPSPAGTHGTAGSRFGSFAISFNVRP